MSTGETTLIELTIDGKNIKIQPGKTVLEAAIANGIEIPHLCYILNSQFLGVAGYA